MVLTALEHHSNYLPWRMRARAVPVTLSDDGFPLYETVEKSLTPRTRLLALAQVPNTTGIIAPVREWVDAAHARGLPLLVDASQSASHMPIDVRALDCDYLVLSGHKLLGPSGIGVLYGKRARLAALGLYQTGGGMVQYHGEDRFEPGDVPQRFEAGTPNIEGADRPRRRGSLAARLGMDAIQEHSLALGAHLVEGLRAIPGVFIVAGSAPDSRRIGLATFSVDSPGISQESLARMLCDRYQILVSGGYHCAHILHHRLRLEGTVRVSTHVFTTHAEIDLLLRGLREIACQAAAAGDPAEHAVTCTLHHADCRCMPELPAHSIELVVTSPPYWMIKDYGARGQIGYGQSLHAYLQDLHQAWAECLRVLREGGRLCVNVGDQFARARLFGRYRVIPLHAEIIAQCVALGFDYLGSIIWRKKTTMNTSGGAVVMGSYPYPPNGIVEIDFEYILLFRRPAKARTAPREIKEAAALSRDEWKSWFSGHWDVGGARKAGHEAPFPEEIPRRLIRMFSFPGDTVLDPFLGTGTTAAVAIELGRNAVGYEINADYVGMAAARLREAGARPDDCRERQKGSRLEGGPPSGWRPSVPDMEPAAPRPTRRLFPPCTP